MLSVQARQEEEEQEEEGKSEEEEEEEKVEEDEEAVHREECSQRPNASGPHPAPASLVRWGFRPFLVIVERIFGQC